MKKLLIGILFSLLSMALLAQWKPGIKGGLNISTIIGLEGENRFSFQAGFMMNHSVGKQWDLQLELIYSQEGQHFYSDTDEEGKIQSLNYIHLPLIFRFSPLQRFHIELGPQFGVLVNATSKGNTVKTNVRDEFRSFHSAFNTGIGIDIQERLAFYARYSIGLMDITVDASSRQIQVGQLGLVWRLK